ncbi:MAG: coagulation factor 5/8 type domain protein [Phycisphaerales bacterium]|nr:coagulation factor 5/8 type domain protein [Phycisphaerales bacterium]
MSPFVRPSACCVALALLVLTSASLAKVIQYPKPAIYEDSKAFALKINGEPVPVIGYSKDYDYALAGLSGERCEIEVTRLDGKPTTRAAVSPRKLEIKTNVAGSRLTFSVKGPQYLIVDIDGIRRLVIAIDPPETDKPASSGTGIYNVAQSPYQADATGASPSTEAIQKAINDAGNDASKQGIVYVPSGVFRITQLQLPSHVALYLDAGAVLRTDGVAGDFKKQFHKDSTRRDGYWMISTVPNATNVKVYGRGTIDGQGKYIEKTIGLINHALVPMACRGFTFDGPVLRESALWGMVIANSRDVHVRNSKHFNRLDMGEDDCIDVCNSQDVTVERSIAISLDDPYSTKTWDADTDIAKQWSGDFEGNKNIRFEDCLAWTRCFSFKIGAGVWKPQEDIVVRNCVSFDGAHAIGISHSYGLADVRNITFENIDAERTTCDVLGRSWARFAIDNKKRETESGGIYDIKVRNIRVFDPGTMPVLMQGLNESRQIHGITFENILMRGDAKPATSLPAIGVTKTQLASDITIKP